MEAERERASTLLSALESEKKKNGTEKRKL